MEQQNIQERMRDAILDAINGLELEARSYGYQDAPEHTKLIAFLESYRAKLRVVSGE